MNLISMSLWGADELYNAGAIANARLVQRIYPGWSLRIYCSPEAPALESLRALGVDVRVVGPSDRYSGLFWRFLPAAESEHEYVIIRDTDSRLNVREKAAVDAWMASGLPFHVMRDHPAHRTTPILGGMWGCRGGSLPEIAAQIQRVRSGPVKGMDQTFLRDEVWPFIRTRCLVHTSVPEPLGGSPFPDHPPYHGCVGEIIRANDEIRETIALLIPSRGRPAAAHAAARSAWETADEPNRLRVLIGVEPDDEQSYLDAFGADASMIHVLRNGGSYVRAIRELHGSVSAGVFGLCADDFRFETAAWDRSIREAARELPERIGLLYGDDGWQGARLATAPFLTAEWIHSVGDILPGPYEHMYCDTELTDLGRRAGLLRFLEQVKITHQHPFAGRAVNDATYERSRGTMSSGSDQYHLRADERERLATVLADASRVPLLSVLVPGLLQRQRELDDLLQSIRHQIEALPDPGRVELLVEPDRGERTVLSKQRSLLQRARGRWVVFLEEGLLAEGALEEVVRTIERTAPDHLTDGGEFSAVRRAIAEKLLDRPAARRGRETRLDRRIYERTAFEVKAAPAPLPPSPRQLRRGFPSHDQLLLLRAALLRDDPAVHAWDEWCRRGGIASVDPAARRLLPLAWWNLQRLGVSSVELNRLKPDYWDSWARIRPILRLAADEVAAFSHHGIPAILLKGVALACGAYEKPELRPMSDVDLLVSESHAEEARRFLEGRGWRPIQDHPSGAHPFFHALGYQDARGRLLDLHWHALLENCRADSDDRFRARTESIEIEGTTARVLAPSDQLLHVCVHGLRWARVPAIHWVADAVTLLNTAGTRIDWDALVEEAKARGVVLQLREALGYLKQEFDLPLLEPVVGRLNAMRCTLGERIEFETRIRPPSLARGFLLHWFDHGRLRRGGSWVSQLWTFPRYWRDVWGLQSLGDLPRTAARKSAQRLARHPGE